MASQSSLKLGSYLSIGAVLAAIVVSSCAHVEPDGASRDPASAFSSSCKKLDKDELATFRSVVKSDGGIAKSVQFMAKLAHIFHDDTTVYDKGAISMETFMWKGGIQFHMVETFAKILVGECNLVRDGEDPNIFVTKAHHPKTYKLAKKLCGPYDADLKPKDRIHPDVERHWVSLDENTPDPDVRRWVSSVNRIYNPSTGDIVMAPDKVVDLCTKFPSHHNIEDVAENLLVCLDAFMLNLFVYDFDKAEYVYPETVDAKQDDQTQNYYCDDKARALKWDRQAKKAVCVATLPKTKSESKNFDRCLQAYVRDEIEVSADGTPVGPKKVIVFGPSTHGPTGPSGASGAMGPSGPSGAKPPTGPTGPSASSGAMGPTGPSAQKPLDPNAPPGDHNSGGKKDGMQGPPSRCLPGDIGDGNCKKDPCINQYADYYRRSPLSLPGLSSNDMEQGWRDERDRYIYEISKHQARLLGQGYIVTSLERNWATPKALNDNLKEFGDACANGQLRGDLQDMMKGQLIEENAPDDAYDVAFADQHAIAESKGEAMIKAVKQIQFLRKLVELLNFDLGAKEVTTWKMPHWVGYLPAGKMTVIGSIIDIPYVSDFEFPVPFLHYFADQDMMISFGNTGNYQCNMFSTMMANDFVVRDKKLLTEADRQIRKLISNSDFSKTAFCVGQNCDPPFLFDYYLKETEPKSFDWIEKKKADGEDVSSYQMHLRDWCSMRWHAAQSLMGLEQQLVSMNPALGHSDMIKGKPGKDDYPGPPLFDRIAKMKGSDADRAKYAKSEADRALPPMQEDLKKYLRKVCNDIGAEAQSTYMAVLNHQFLFDFDYCAGLKPDEAVRLGLPCENRVGFLQCKIQQEADSWQAKKEMPKFLYQVAMAGMDALFVYSVASGGIAAIFTPRGLITGGLVGVGFTYGNFKISEWIAHNNEGLWNDYHAGTAALALEGVDSYANALTSMAASQPKMKVQDFVMGFIMGAAFSGKPEGEVGAAKGSGPKSTPKEVFAEVAKKVSDFAESESGGGVKFSPKSLSELKDWMMQKTAENPEFANELTRNLGDHLLKLSDADYARLFDGPEGKFSAARVRRALAVRLKNVASKVGKVLGDAKAKIAMKKLTNVKLTSVETLIDETGLQAPELAGVAKDLGPRELASLADAAEDAVKDVAGEKPAGKMKRVADFLRKLCSLAISCTGLQSLKGCPL